MLVYSTGATLVFAMFVLLYLLRVAPAHGARSSTPRNC